MKLELLLNAPHLLETALLLLAAFLVGAAIGTLARLATLRGRGPIVVPEAAVEPAAVATGAPELVVAPQVDPLPVGPAAPTQQPAASLDETMSALVADIASAVSALGAEEARSEPAAPVADDEIKPARVAGRSASGKAVQEPVRSVAAVPDGRPPLPDVEVAAAAFAESSGNAVAAEEPVEAAAAAEQALVAEMGESSGPPAETGAQIAIDTPIAAAPAESGHEPAPMGADPAIEPAEAPDPAAEAPPRQRRREEADEGAAMRAIEGNWSPRRRTARPAAAEPQAADAAVAASGEAVAAAIRAAEAAVGAPVAVPVARPSGLGLPRGGARDDLTRIVGVLPILETALNGLGLFHFDQIAELTELNVGWLEDYLGIQGRIGRERWREQARRLADEGAARQAAQ